MSEIGLFLGEKGHPNFQLLCYGVVGFCWLAYGAKHYQFIFFCAFMYVSVDNNRRMPYAFGFFCAYMLKNIVQHFDTL